MNESLTWELDLIKKLQLLKGGCRPSSLKTVSVHLLVFVYYGDFKSVLFFWYNMK